MVRHTFLNSVTLYCSQESVQCWEIFGTSNTDTQVLINRTLFSQERPSKRRQQNSFVGRIKSQSESTSKNFSGSSESLRKFYGQPEKRAFAGQPPEIGRREVKQKKIREHPRK